MSRAQLLEKSSGCSKTNCIVSTYSYVTFGIVRPILIEIGLDDAVDVTFSKAIKNLDSHLRSLAFLSSYLHTSPPATSFYEE